MNKELKSFQIFGAQTLAANPHYLLADQPGLGKTAQAIHACELVGAKKILVVCPASVRSHWKKEIAERLGRVDGWTIVSYNGVASGCVGIPEKVDAIILDECHFLKSIDSLRSLAVFGKTGIVRRAKYKWCLTGTPVLNRPRELYPLLKTLAPAFAQTTYARFTQRYCGAFWDGRGINDRGATNLDELARLLKTFMLRRTKKEVFGEDRKEPIVSYIPIDLSAQDLRAVLAEEDSIDGREAAISEAHNHFSQMGDTSKLLRLLGEAKVPHIVEFVEDLLETEYKVVVFAYHRNVIEKLQAHFMRYRPAIYVGGMNDAQKSAAIKTFAQPECRVFIGQRVAAGTGINGLQTVCSSVVIAEPSWVPGETEQMIDRLDRIGQEDDIVNAYLLYAQNTLDEVVVRVHDRKGKIVDKLMGGEDSWI